MLRAIYALLLFILSFSAQSGYEYDATYNLASTEIVEIDRKNCHYDDTSNFCDNGRQRISSYSQKKTQDGSFFAFDVGLVAAKGVKELTKQQQKSVRSLEKQISKHEKKLQEFRDNPTVRPGMEKLPKEVIQKQQQRRINHLETEIRTFRNNIEKIKRGDIDS